MRERPLALKQDDLVDYNTAIEQMAALVEQRQRGDISDMLWLLSHPMVFTVGRRTRPEHLPDPNCGVPVLETNRGGQLTFHGPGQLVGYLIVLLDHDEGIVDYVREVEVRLIAALAELDLAAERRVTPPGEELLTGVWTSGTGRKIASIGICQSRGVSSHGFALNVDVDMEPWSWAVACGLRQVEMTSIQRELGTASMVTTREVVTIAFNASRN
jgi:lipoyl(octanoyl) transferase